MFLLKFGEGAGRGNWQKEEIYMKKSISRLASFALAASLMAVSVAGCGGSKTTAGNNGGTTAASSGAEAAAGGQTSAAAPETEPVAASSTLGERH